MIRIPQPALALNSHNVPPPNYRMWNTGIVDEHKSPLEIITWIRSIASSAPGGVLRAVILNAHGFAINGQLGYGISLGTGIDYRHVDLFSQLQGKVEKIYITACGAGHISSTHTPGGAGDGHYFLSSIARNAQAIVIASTELQGAPSSIPRYHIDNFEGLMVVYDHLGHFAGSARYRSMWPNPNNPSTYYGENG